MPAGAEPPDEGSSFSEIELFAPLSEQEIRDLGRRVPEMSLEKGQIFYTPWHRGESFFLLVQGRIRIFRVREAREVTLSVKHPGEFFGEAALAGMPKGAWAQALEPVTLAIMGRKALHRLIADKPRVGAMMVELLVERLGVYEDKLEEFSLMDTPVRLASLLVRMIETEGVPDDGGYMMIPSYLAPANADLDAVTL